MNATKASCFRMVALALPGLLPVLPALARKPVTDLLPAPTSLPAFAPWVVVKQFSYHADAGYDATFLVAKGGVAMAKQVVPGATDPAWLEALQFSSILQHIIQTRQPRTDLYTNQFVQ